MNKKECSNRTMDNKIVNCLFAIVTIVILSAASPSYASDLAIPLELGEPNFFGIGIGMYPDYFGSDDYSFGGGPIGKVMIGDERYINIVVNDLLYLPGRPIDDDRRRQAGQWQRRCRRASQPPA